jgi:glutamate decarboxylase
MVTPPELNIMTYRIRPAAIKKELEKCGEERKHSLNETLNEINITVQRLQREAGKSFVSRTTLKIYKGCCKSIVVLRCVIMNPLTDIDILRDILDEQEEIYRREFGQS